MNVSKAMKSNIWRPYKKILHIDDDPDWQEIFLYALKKTNCAVNYVASSCASEALSRLKKAELTADIILLDLNMPQMNGLQFLVAIKECERLQHIPVIIFSNSENSSTMEVTKLLGAYDFITKPRSLHTLIKILYSLLERHKLEKAFT